MEPVPEQGPEEPEELVDKKAQFKQTPLENMKNKKTTKTELSKFFKNGF